MEGRTPRIIASIEARLGASRLPGKVLADIGGTPVLGHVVARLRTIERLDGIVLATTDTAADDPLAAWAADEGIAVFRGSEEDVLGRVVEAQRMLGSDIVVEVSGDTPFLDPDILAMAIDTFLTDDCDVVSNTFHLSYPQGIDAQVFPWQALADVAEAETDPAVREHVSLFFYEHPERYRIRHLQAPSHLQLPAQRLQLDYPEDLDFLRALHTTLAPDHGDKFGVEEIVSILRQQPELAEINRHCEEKPVR